jgi:YVTN family beta-propeller protein
MKKYAPLAAGVAALILGGAFYFAAPRRVGPNPDGSFTVATMQTVRSAGETLTFGGRPVDMVVAPDGKAAYLKDNRGFVRLDLTAWKVAQSLPFPKDGGGSLHGITVSRDGKRVWASGAKNSVWEAEVGADGALRIAREIPILAAQGKSASYPCGLTLSPNEQTLYVCLSMSNAVAAIDLASGKVTKEIPVGVAPYDVVVSADGKTAWVSNWGGRRPKTGERTAPSAGTETLVDERGIGNSGTVSLLDLDTGAETVQVNVGLHPSDLALTRDGKTLYIANVNDDTVSVVDTARRVVRETVVVKPDAKLAFGSMPNALTLSPDEKTLYVACGGNNAVAALSLEDKSRIAGWIPAGWYPGAVSIAGDRLLIANIKGNGSRGATGKEKEKGWNVYQYEGTVNRLPLPDTKTLAALTRQVVRDARVPETLRAMERARSGRKPVPIPERAGEPSPIQHVVYIIKENRTYDQVFGDIKQGDGNPSLCIFGRDITPNHHALAEQFVLLDNFYCNGVLSADGHSWVTEGNNTDHLEKAFGGFTRSYTFGDDPLTYSSSGFLWDNVLARGLSFRNYGEMDYTDESPDVNYTAIYDDWKNKTGNITFKHRIGIERLRRYSAPDSIGWNMDIPDVMRAEIFLRDLKRYETENNLPNMVILYLPNDHTSGTTPGDPTPRAYMADNDLAVGQIVEGLSKSKFWPKAAIFVVEDDPQAGFDHVDGHRSLCLVISPYTKRGAVVSDFYNQTSVIHTMERILGLPPMNQMDAMSPVMATCFQNKPDLRPYTCLPNKIPLTEVNPPRTALNPAARKWADTSASLNFRKVDAADEDTLNRILWHAMKGAETPYPAHVAGAHGKGLKARGLSFDKRVADDDD